MIPDSFKQDLLNRVDIVDVVSRYVQLKKAGASHQGLCPFHTEKTPSFTVSPAKQFYHCFGCGAHGNAIGFLMAHASLGYVDAVKELASGVGMQVPESRPVSPAEQARREREPDLFAVMEKAMAFYRAELKRSPRAIDYLKRRGISGEIAARFGLGYAPDDWQGLKKAFDNYADAQLVECGLVIEGDDDKRYDRFRDRVMFPIFNARGNAVIGFGGRILDKGEPKYLNSPETPLFQKGREIYNLARAIDAIRAEGRALVVEGYMDVIGLAQHGVGYAVATLGTATTPDHVAKLLRLADELVFCFDGDAAGRKAAWRALEVGLALAPDHKPLRFLFLPEGEDPDTYVRGQGKEVFEKRVRESATLSEFLIGELRAQSDLGTAEGRSALLVAAKPLVQRIAAPSLRLQVLKQVAELAQVSQDEAGDLLGLRSGPVYSRRAPVKVDKAQPSSLEWKLLTRVFARPALAFEVDRELLDEKLDASEALIELAEKLSELDRVEPDEAAMMEFVRSSRHSNLLAKARDTLRELRLSTEEAVAEFHAGLEQLKARLPVEQSLLGSKVLRGVASAEERRRFLDQAGRPKS